MHEPDLVPYLSYRDAGAAIDFLGRAFGFEVVRRMDGEDGAVLHAELRRGNGMVMIGTAEAEKGSPGLYLVVEDLDAAAGAEEVYPPEDTEFGTRRWRCRDPEGHEWSVGTYAPRSEPPAWA